MRRIVAGTTGGERSAVLSATTIGTEGGPAIFRYRMDGDWTVSKLPAIPDEVFSTDAVVVHLWGSPGPDLARVGTDPHAEATVFDLVPDPEGLYWRYHVWGPGFSSDAHTTETLDLMMVITGEVTLILDEEDVLLQAGDTLILQAASHGWRAGDEGCTFVHLMRRLT
jgi:hypothetical protein